MKKSTTKKLQIVNKKETEALRELLAGNAQLVLPMLELLEQSKSALNGLFESAGRAMIARAPGCIGQPDCGSETTRQTA